MGILRTATLRSDVLASRADAGRLANVTYSHLMACAHTHDAAGPRTQFFGKAMAQLLLVDTTSLAIAVRPHLLAEPTGKPLGLPIAQ